MSVRISNRSSQVKGSGDTFSWRRSRELLLTSSVSAEEKSPLISSTSWGDPPRNDKSINASNSWILSTSVDHSYTYQQQPLCEYKNRPTSIKEFVCVGICILMAITLFSIPIILRYIPIEVGECFSF